MTDRFVYDHTDIERQYDKARELPQKTYCVWKEAIKANLPHETISFIGDIGCGTGRFTALLADTFSVRVVGIDPSEKMLEKARQNRADPGTEFIVGTAEKLPLEEDSKDLLFLSMSYHHIQNISKALTEFKRVLKKPGYVIIRTATRQSMLTYPWVRFFPAAREIEMSRLPDRTGIIDLFNANGFTLLNHDTVTQQFAKDYTAYYSKLSLRGLSSLKAISDHAFQSGCDHLKTFCEQQPLDLSVDEEIDLYVFTR